MSNTKILNLFGGPGISKSTTAAGIFYKLKEQHINCSLVQEFAKELTFLNDWTTLSIQPYVSVTQYYRQVMCEGQVDFIITDSPIILGAVYPGKGVTPGFEAYLLELFEEFNNINFLLERNNEFHPYLKVGRTQDLNESIQKDIEIKELLDRHSITYTTIPVNEITVSNIIELLHDEGYIDNGT